MCGSAVVAPQWSCCMASAQQATCGVIWRARSSKTTRLSRPTCVGWASRRSRMAATTRRTRPRTWGASRPAGWGVRDALGVRTAELVTHDIGIMVGFAAAATYRERVSRWVAIDAPLPGIGPWDQIIQDPTMWHFGFGGQDMERLVAGRERIYLDRFWNELSRDPKRFDEAKRQHYAALYAQPGAMRAGFAQFLAFSQDATDNR